MKSCAEKTGRADISRRQLLKEGGAVAGALSAVVTPFAIARAAKPARIAAPYGVQCGDVLYDRAVLWSYADHEARMWVELADNDAFRNARRVRGPVASPDTGMTARLDVQGLTPGRAHVYRIWFESLDGGRHDSAPRHGRFVTPTAASSEATARPVRFLWSGDVAGQGWGINPELGGMRIFDTMRRLAPDFFIHCGDSIYADNPIEPEVTLPDGVVWRNRVTPAKQAVAQTLDEFRGNYRYNLLDDNLRAFNAQVPMYAQWDDHEVVNNWYPGELLDDDRYDEKSVDVLAARAHRAFAEYMPVRFGPRGRLYQSFSCGPHLEIFRLDMRSFRGPNSANLQSRSSAATAFLGSEQLAWLKTALRRSRARWKIIAADMPIGLVVRDGDHFEAVANADHGAPLGRELEVADLLAFVRRHDIRNLVWLTADVHYTAAHHYHPDRAAFQNFLPFYEFVSGPLNAGTFGPNELDRTFGPEVLYQKAPEGGEINLPPSAGMQFFGQVDVSSDGQQLTVTLRDVAGEALFTRILDAD
jgi:alkaline phosphatase D